MSGWFARACIAVLVLAGPATAQGTINVQQGLLPPGGEVAVGYSNPDRAGETVVVEMDDGGYPVQKDTVEITLDAQGNGAALWVAPSEWFSVRFNGPEAGEETRFIGPPGEGG